MAGAERLVGITIKAKDLVSQVVKKLANNTKDLGKVFKGLASGMRAIGASIIVANQGIELLSKGFSAVSRLVSATVNAAIELRSETDPLVLNFRRLQSSLKSVAGAMGSALLASITAVGGGFRGAIGDAKKFVEQNKKLIATRIVQYLFKAAQAITEGVAGGMSVANDLWATFTVTVDESVMSVSKFVGTLAKMMKFYKDTFGSSTAIGALASLGEWQGMIDDMAEAYTKAEKRIAANTIEHGEFADQIQRVKNRILELIREGYTPALAAVKVITDNMKDTPWETQEQAILRLRSQIAKMAPELERAAKSISEGLSFREGILAFEEVERRLDRVQRSLGFLSTESIPVLEAALRGVYEGLGLPFEFNIDTSNLELAKEQLTIIKDALEVFVLDSKESLNIFNDRLEEQVTWWGKMRDEIAQFPATFAAFGNTVGDVIGQVKNGAMELAEAQQQIAVAFFNMLLETVEKAVLAYAVEGAAAAFAGNAGAPGVGLIVGATMAAGALALIRGYLGQLPQPMAQGGFVTGGVANRDSVPAMLMPGEYVMSKRDVDAAQRGGGLGGPVINIELSSKLPANRSEMKKFVRQNIVPALHELKSQGMF